MYEYIKGILSEKGLNYAVLETNGVGYRICAGAHTLSRLSGEKAMLYTYLHVREEEQTLYGFSTKEERNMFLKLIAISGVGPKVALGVLSGMTAGEVAAAVITGDAKAFTGVSGVGNKTAQRIILELKEKIDSRETIEIGSELPDAAGDPVSEAVHALLALGYARNEAQNAVCAVRKLAGSPEELILLALKRMDRG